MSHEGVITVTFGAVKRKFKMGTSPRQVLKSMAEQFPPRGALLHEADEGLIVSSQEETLSQKEYIYVHPDVRAPSSSIDRVDLKVRNAVLRLQVASGGELITYGTAVVFTSEGMCLTANHCLEAAGIRRSSLNLRVGGHTAKVVAVDTDLDIVCVKITESTEFDFIPLDYDISPQMPILLLSYPAMVDEFKTLHATITHGQVTNILNSFQCAGDYACFPNSSGGAVVSNNRLVGIHVAANYFEESKESKGIMKSGERLEWLERNQAHKGSLGIFVTSSSVGRFLAKNNIIREGVVQPSSSQSRNPVMVSTRQSSRR